jgi:HEAT repeat protein
LEVAESTDALAGLARDDKANHVRIAAVEALGHVGGEAAVRAVAPLLKSDEPDLVRAAVTALGRIGNVAARSLLLEALQSPDAGGRAAAAEALGMTDGERQEDFN